MVISLLPALVTANVTIIIICQVGLLPATRNSPLTELLITITHNSHVSPMCSSCVPLWPRLSSLTSEGTHPLCKCLLVMWKLHLFLFFTSVLIGWKDWRWWNLSNLKSYLPLHVIYIFSSLIGSIHNIPTHAKHVLEQLLELAPPRPMTGGRRHAATSFVSGSCLCCS